MRNRVKVYLALIIVLIGLQLFRKLSFDRSDEVVKAYNNDYAYNAWNDIIVENTNARKIKVSIDGNIILPISDEIYMDKERNFLIKASILPEKFMCSYHVYESFAIVEKGNTRIVLNFNDKDMLVNDERISMKTSMQKIDGEVYIPLEVMTHGFEYGSDYDCNTNTYSLVDTRKMESIIPVRYDYRENHRMSSIKNQGTHSTCWAFASLAALESSLLPDYNKDYSEKNMTLNNGFVVSLMSGGDYTMATSYLAAWLGPINEAEEEGYGKYETPKELKADVHVQEIQMIESKELEEIKRIVFLYGGVESSIFMAINANNLNSYYYNKNTASYCYVGTERPNHDVVIVGWDDNYSKENFNYVPEGDGAFICQNSWGEEFGDGGVFYVSYYDSNIGAHNVAYTKVESNDNYDNIYQSDICGMVGQLGYESEEAYFANAYVARGDETLRAVSFYSTGKNTEYEIYIVDNFTDEHSFDERRFLQKGSFSNAGYYTVEFNSPVNLKAGEKYAVVIKIKTPNAVHPVPIEYIAGYETANVIIEDGEGYISYLGKSWERVEETKNCNVCLKMFTDNKE